MLYRASLEAVRLPRQDSILDINTEVKEAFLYWVSVMDEMTGGVFKRGWREASPVERLKEWDALTAEQVATLKQNKGEEWFAQQGAQIEKIRKQLEIG